MLLFVRCSLTRRKKRHFWGARKFLLNLEFSAQKIERFSCAQKLEHARGFNPEFLTLGLISKVIKSQADENNYQVYKSSSLVLTNKQNEKNHK